MTTPDQQARTLREAIERQRAAQEAAQGLARDIARERAEAGPAEPSIEDGQ